MLHYFDLHRYQLRLASFMTANPFCAAWVDMGLGKTPSTLTAYVDLRRTGLSRNALIVGPLRVANKVWPDEIGKWSHLEGLTFQRITGTPMQRWKALNTPADIHLVNREQLEWLLWQFCEKKGSKWNQLRTWPWDVVVLDESQSFKSQSSYRWEAAKIIRRMCHRFIELTGTPIPNGYKDLWAQLYLLDQGARLGATENAFLERWFDPADYEGHGWKLKPGAQAEIQQRVADVVMVLREEDYLELPPITYNPVRVSLSAAALKQYRRMERDYLIEFGDRKVTAVNAGVCAGKLAQLANGAVYHDRAGNWTHLHEEKINALLELLDGASGRQMLVAYGFRHDRQRLEAAYRKFYGNKKKWAMLDEPHAEDAWNAGDIETLSLHPAGGGEGSNLHLSGAETITWFGLTNNYAHYAQLNARLAGGQRRVGKKVVINQIIADQTIDEDLVVMMGRKGGDQNELMRMLATRAAAVC